MGLRHSVCAMWLLVAGCAAGERWGGEPERETEVDESCRTDLDCHDGNACTADVCDEDGTCLNPWICGDDTDAIAEAACADALEILESQAVAVHVPGANSPPDQATPIEQGAVIKLDVREPTRVHVTTSREESDVLLVLLRDCANAASNRIAWGEDIYSGTLDIGEYYLLALSSKTQSLVLNIHFLRPTSCDDAEVIDANGAMAGTVDGFADGFEGSCCPATDDGHRGDRVYAFTVPDDEIWNLEAHLVYETDEHPFYLFLRRGCSGEGSIEIACANPITAYENAQGSDVLSLRFDGLESGSYTLFVDAIPSEKYDLGDYLLQIEFLKYAKR